MLYSPRQAGPLAARANLWFALTVLALGGGVADYPLLFGLKPAGLVDARVQATPEGFTRPAILIFLILQIAAPILLPLAAWIAGEVMNAYLYLVLDAKVERREVLHVTAHGFLPFALQGFSAAAIRLVSGPDSNRFNPVASNVGFFLDSTETSVFWYEFARSLDLFAIWAMVITAVGLGGLTRRQSLVLLPPLAAAWLAAIAFKAWLLA